MTYRDYLICREESIKVFGRIEKEFIRGFYTTLRFDAISVSYNMDELSKSMWECLTPVLKVVNKILVWLDKKINKERVWKTEKRK